MGFQSLRLALGRMKRICLSDCSLNKCSVMSIGNVLKSGFMVKTLDLSGAMVCDVAAPYLRSGLAHVTNLILRNSPCICEQDVGPVLFEMFGKQNSNMKFMDISYDEEYMRYWNKASSEIIYSRYRAL